MELGFRLGALNGLELGLRLGPPDGLELGLALGCSDGLELGFQLGRFDGLELGFMLGDLVWVDARRQCTLFDEPAKQAHFSALLRAMPILISSTPPMIAAAESERDATPMTTDVMPMSSTRVLMADRFIPIPVRY